MGLSDDQAREVATIAELEVRRYFDQYLNEVFPEQMRAVRSHMHLMIERHNSEKKAHGGVERKVTRYFWWIMGASSVIGLLFGDVGQAIVVKLLKP